ncbi:hypothetical protein L195_g008252 [Trifolium pratense]|uniref:Uncharacterized protein n=1 Tax=Trifolium pratense TaxID=57577 RepID=A0A2K3P8M7_TRIPR|nr:hypothetical protein L195_g008252 [Trifolium pratense]
MMDSTSRVSRRTYPPLLFYMDSDVDYHGRIIFKGNKSSSESKMVSKNSIPLSFYYNTTVVYYPSLSKMDIFLSNHEETTMLPNKNHPLSFYFYSDSTDPDPWSACKLYSIIIHAFHRRLQLL